MENLEKKESKTVELLNKKEQYKIKYAATSLWYHVGRRYFTHIFVFIVLQIEWLKRNFRGCAAPPPLHQKSRNICFPTVSGSLACLSLNLVQ